MDFLVKKQRGKLGLGEREREWVGEILTRFGLGPCFFLIDRLTQRLRGPRKGPSDEQLFKQVPVSTLNSSLFVCVLT